MGDLDKIMIDFTFRDYVNQFENKVIVTSLIIGMLVYILVKFFIKRRKAKQWINEYNRSKPHRCANTLRIKQRRKRDPMNDPNCMIQCSRTGKVIKEYGTRITKT